LGPPAGALLVAEGEVADDEGDVAVADVEEQAAVSPITAHSIAAAAIRPLLVFGSNRRTFAAAGFPAAVGPVVAVASGRAGVGSSGPVTS
jgi:hypothetical protein